MKRSLLVTMCLASLLTISPAAEPTTAKESPKLEPIVVGQPAAVDVFPPAIKLAAARRYMHLLVTGTYANGEVQDLTRAAQYVSSNAKVAQVDTSGVVTPVADG